MQIHLALGTATASLTDSPSSRLDAELLLAHVLGCSRIDLFTNENKELNHADLAEFQRLVTRRAAGEPISQILDRREFFGLDFMVSPAVLTPRPETEILVEAALEYLADRPKFIHARVLDLGTGSGCIAIALKKTRPDLIVQASDISPAALAIATANAAHHGVEIEFVESDLLSGLVEPADLILANLPYIGTQKYKIIDPAVERYEPGVALWGGADGLELYRRLFAELGERSWQPQLILCELSPEQAEEFGQIVPSGYNLGYLPDLTGRPRVARLVRQVS